LQSVAVAAFRIVSWNKTCNSGTDFDIPIT